MSALNPEFRRNLWLELSTQRLIIMPAILFLVFLLGWTFDKAAGMAGAAMIVGWLLLVFWGTRLACDAMVSEVQARTWDGQRLSGIGPFAMTLGKLFGGTSYAWYGGLMCLAAVLMSGGLERDPWAPVRLVETGLFAQAVALWFGLVQLRLQAGVRRFQITFAQVLAILVSAQFAPALTRFDVSVTWYGMSFPAADFALFATGLFTLWAWVGCWRLMRAELQYRCRPIAWVAFLCFLFVFVGGFTGGMLQAIAIRDLEGGLITNTLGFHVLLGANWLAALLEPKSIVRLRRLGERAKRGEIGRALEDLPMSVAGLPVVLLLGIAAVASLGGEGRAAAQIGSEFLFLLRDGLLIYFVVLGPSTRRGHVAAMLYLVVLYGLIPALLEGAGGGEVIAAFVPLGGISPVIGIVGPLVQAAGFAVLLATRFTAPRRDRP